MSLKLNSSGGGSVTLQEPSTASNLTLTLPDTTGTLLSTGSAVTVAQGGTGATTLTANNVILGNGTSAVAFVAPSTSGNVLTSNGTTWTSAALSTTPVLAATAGASVGAVGTYALLFNGPATRSPGDTLAGSSLTYAGCDGNNATAVSGTWRLMGRNDNVSNRQSTSVWLRIS